MKSLLLQICRSVINLKHFASEDIKGDQLKQLEEYEFINKILEIFPKNNKLERVLDKEIELLKKDKT